MKFKKLRNWLIKKLAGNRSMIINCVINFDRKELYCSKPVFEMILSGITAEPRTAIIKTKEKSKTMSYETRWPLDFHRGAFITKDAVYLFGGNN